MRIIKNRRARLMVVAMLIAVGSSATAWSNVELGATIETAITSGVSTQGAYDARAELEVEQVVGQVVGEQASEVTQIKKEEKREGTIKKVGIVIAIVLAVLATILIVFSVFSRHNRRPTAGGAINGEEVAAIATALSLYKAEMSGGASRGRGGRGGGAGRSARGGSEWNSKLLNMRKIPDKGRGWNS